MQTHRQFLDSCIFGLRIPIRSGRKNNGFRGETHDDHFIELVFMEGLNAPNVKRLKILYRVKLLDSKSLFDDTEVRLSTSSTVQRVNLRVPVIF